MTLRLVAHRPVSIASRVRLLPLLAFVVASIAFTAGSGFGRTLISLNQVGYFPKEPKFAVIASTDTSVIGRVSVVSSDSSVTFSPILSADQGPTGVFTHSWTCDFTRLRKESNYHISIDSLQSAEFRIGKSVYKPLPDSLLRFFRVQRCGSNDPLLHKACHRQDAKGISPTDSATALDLTGGWHDAADYIKFCQTTAYSTYLLLLNADLFPGYWSNHPDSLPNPLSEAKLGMVWLMKMHPKADILLSQVQDIADHSSGWRMPEDDTLAGKRYGYTPASQAQAGSIAAALAIGSRLYHKVDPLFADSCRRHSEEIWRLIYTGTLPRTVSLPDSHYFDEDPNDNIALAAAELYELTRADSLLDTCLTRLQELGGVGWVSWGDLAAFAAFRVSHHSRLGSEMLVNAAAMFDSSSAGDSYGYPVADYPWGSTGVVSGIGDLALLAGLAKRGQDFRALALRQRDFLLGTNPFSVSFVAGIGEDYPRALHHQIGMLANTQIPGAVAGGPVSAEVFATYKIAVDSADRFQPLQTSRYVYHDDRNDYLCNEPTISTNAQTLLLMTWAAAGAPLR